MKIFLLLSSIFLILSSFFYIWYVKKGPDIAQKLGKFFAFLALIFHFVFAIFLYAMSRRIPVLSLREALATFGWSSVFAFLIFMRGKGEESLGAFIMPMAGLCEIALLFYPPARNPVPESMKTILFPIHISFAFLGYAFFSLSFISGISYLLTERIVKKKTSTVFSINYPPLLRVEELNIKSVSLGFPFLTLAIITGMLWSLRARGVFWSWDPKEVWTLITWFIYAIPLHLRFAGWRGKRLAYASITGFFVLLFTFLGAGTLFKGYHRF